MIGKICWHSGLEPWTPKLLGADQSLYPLGHHTLLPDVVFKPYIYHMCIYVCKSHLGIKINPLTPTVAKWVQL